MHDGINLSYVGLSELEIRVLKSIFSLAPQLQANYTLISPNELEKADLVLVNADDSASIRKWAELKQENSLVSALMLTDNEKNIGANTMQRPIRVQKLISALEEVVERTSIKSEEDDKTVNLNILVVDDSFPVRKYMEHKLPELARIPLKISFASSGEEAIARSAKEVYDIIFLDVMMEGMDGYKVCKAIKAQREAYIVMLTSKKSPFDKVRGTMSGCDGYITKPPADERLAEELKNGFARRGGATGRTSRINAS